MLFKLSNPNSNLALTLGYLNPALNNSAQVFFNPRASLVPGVSLLPLLRGGERGYWKNWSSVFLCCFLYHNFRERYTLRRRLRLKTFIRQPSAGCTKK